MLQARELTSTPSPFVVFTFELIVESIKELGGASIWVIKIGCLLELIHLHSF
jgi:hypothetical protein